MRRVHAFEFHDLDWWPNSWRLLLLDTLFFLWILWDPLQQPYRWFMAVLRWVLPIPVLTRPFQAVSPLLADVMRQCKESNIVDLCSGAGGPLSHIQRDLEENHNFKCTVQLTDLYPQQRRWNTIHGVNENITYVAHPVDACAVPEEYRGVRTFMASFHHFRPPIARRILQDVVTSRAPVVIVEGTERTLSCIFSMAVVGTILLPFFTLFLRPVTLKRLFFTFVVPVAPLQFFWDTTLSCLRTYTRDELRDLINEVDGHETYTWEMGRKALLPRTPIPLYMTYLVGIPKKL